MSDFIGLVGSYSQTGERELSKIVAKTLGSGEPAIQLHQSKSIYLCAVNHGKQDLITFYSDPLNRYTVILYGYIASFDLLEAELRKSGVKPEKDLMALILQAYKVSTPDFVDYLRGNFSLIIADSVNGSVYLAKDHFGSCPLYYSEPMRRGVRFFGSNIPAMAEHPDFEKEFNPRALAYYLSLEYNPMRESFWRKVYSLRPGHWALISEDGLREEAYFKAAFTPDERSLAEHAEEIRQTVRKSVESYMKDDKAGAYLSGGVDSAFVTILAQPEDIFSIGYEGYTGIFNEAEQAQSLADRHGMNFHSASVSGRDYLDALLHTQQKLNEPNGNLSTVALCLLGKLVDQRVSVILTGDGADEFFGGYDSYLGLSGKKQLYKKIMPESLRSFISSRIKSDIPYYSRASSIKHCGMKASQYFFGTNQIVNPAIVNHLLIDEFMPEKSLEEFFASFYNEHAAEDELTQKMLLDINYILPGDMCVKQERMANAHNLQLRTPLLNKSVFETASTVPSHMRVSERESKIPFRQAAAEVLDQNWIHHRKLGFPVPFRYYLQDKTIAQPLYDILSDPLTERFFRRETIDRYLDEHLKQKRARHMELYIVLAFMLWYKENFTDLN
ncbi:MAG: hypothetical protein GX034_03490 [Clostridiaceae bacterium]|nr:hypothetical protein [Clostridiaceae bacterium]